MFIGENVKFEKKSFDIWNEDTVKKIVHEIGDRREYIKYLRDDRQDKLLQ